MDQAYDGGEGQYLAESEDYDLVILDVMLPKVDGVTLCQALRSEKIKTPVLMLTAKTTIEDKVRGLDSGADDYMTKPFSFVELKSRIQALLRRGKQDVSPVMQVVDLTLDPLKHKVERAGKTISMTPKEFAVLEFLMRHEGEIVTRTMIIEHVWDYNFDSMSNIVDVYVTAIRRKVDKGAKTKLVHTIHGVGYQIAEKL